MENASSVDAISNKIIVASDYQEGVIEFLKEKKKRRLIKILLYPQSESAVKVRTIFGGALYQQADSHILHTSDLKIVTERQPTQAELEDMLFAWRIVKHVKSNDIVYAKGRAPCGIGAGQTSRGDRSVVPGRRR